MTEILITGATGQLGSELRNLLDERNVAYDAFDSHGLDITDEETVMSKVEELQPKVIYHCAAYTAVDNAEDQFKAANWQVNETGTQNIAQAAKKVGALLVYVSTDYVFDGINPGEYKEDDPTNPKNEYGKAKLAGEEIVKQTLDNYYIVRTSWVFGKYGRNFVYTMLRLAKDHDRLTVVNDQFGRPTWTRTLAEFITHLVDTKSPYGTYQLSNDDSCSWYEFAKEILVDKDVEVAPVTSEEYPQKAYRPRHSIMSLEKAKATGYKIPTWQEALKAFMSDIEDGQEN
ncbi:dTDP-4-dehydrorhamnose reductase [Limosilactobacillus fermentum]|uniref:dTDP-4-dehydrorhamnose reductase n=1 Tax=Limosilactobacillus fermentum (strain NBRC 3956 / LMG 18251) TaxID=334390 RepID=A0ABF7R0I1_LIMF3|nr:dTDP-4-dehydrorhamnose reductase [Limosilactobacillus fermentum]ADJ40751.1 dTDP-4-dehydrorhamnose reductase [Limosilactobacillus fermentum CECT 5716]EQC58615.1 dTDP-4-dehydrorhamnose reductase [Limosilactobacillus fermentum MTCC 8711]BAG26435.1 dTDP-4-dehydrorhamnose reductase [Limosilactobacillus fermentum IFO 3956]GEA97046.1 NAD(P)-dependent oxidoreductase [Limosilactobacillus fermentum]